MLEVKISTLHDEPEPDRRYRVMVLLNRSDRPTHYKFHCPRCTAWVAEIVNAQVVAMSDMVSFTESTNPMLGVQCDGRIFDGGDTHLTKCRIFYMFSMSDTTNA